MGASHALVNGYGRLVGRHWNEPGHGARLGDQTNEGERGAGSMLIATEGIMITVFIVVMVAILTVVARVRVMLEPMHNALRHMRPFVQVQYAEGVESEGEGEEAAHAWRI